MFVDLYSVRVQSLLAAWLASCVGFYFLAPHVSRLFPSLTISPAAGIVAASAFFGWQIWRAVRTGPKEGELSWVESP